MNNFWDDSTKKKNNFGLSQPFGGGNLSQPFGQGTLNQGNTGLSKSMPLNGAPKLGSLPGFNQAGTNTTNKATTGGLMGFDSGSLNKPMGGLSAPTNQSGLSAPTGGSGLSAPTNTAEPNKTINLPNATNYSGPPDWLNNLIKKMSTGKYGANRWMNRNANLMHKGNIDLRKQWNSQYGTNSQANQYIRGLGTNSRNALNDQMGQHNQWWGQANNNLGDYESSINNLSKAPELYDQWVDKAGQAYLNRQTPFEESIRKPMASLSASGGFDSSLARDALTDVARERARGFQQHQEQLGTQALGLKAQNLSDVASQRGNLANLSGQMAGQAMQGRNSMWNQYLQGMTNQAQLGQNQANNAWQARVGMWGEAQKNTMNTLNWLGNLMNMSRYNKSNTPQLGIMPYL